MRNEVRFILLSTILFLKVISLSGQIVDPREAREYYKHHNYLAAIPVYKKVIKQDPNKIDFYIEIADCFLNINGNKGDAIPYLERALKIENNNDQVKLFLAKAYMFSLRYEDALNLLNEIKSSEKQLQKLKEDCEFGIKEMKNPKNVSFENIGKNINSKYPDYYPFISKDESTILFTSRRKESKGKLEFDGYYPADVFMATKFEDNWKKSINKFSFNSTFDEIAVGISDDGEQLYIYVDDYVNKEVGDIWVINKVKGKFTKREKLGSNVNTKDIEIACSISADGQTLFFTSNKPGGVGGMDIYMSRMLPTMEWGPPQPIGGGVNTIDDEDFPTLSNDGKTLYFTSNGLPGMGGFDLYQTIWDPTQNSWSNPINLGFPINGPEDNKVISFTQDGKHAYLSKWMDDSYGDLDIYRITFNDVQVNPATFVMTIFSGDSLNPVAKNGYISVENEDVEEIGNFIANPKSGKIIVTLDPGKYSLYIGADGVEDFDQEIEVKEFQTKMPLIQMILTPPNH